MSGLKPDHLYVVQQRYADDLYAVSPDGEGVFWYETDEQLDEAYGEGNFTSCTCLTMDEFDELRYPMPKTRGLVSYAEGLAFAEALGFTDEEDD